MRFQKKSITTDQANAIETAVFQHINGSSVKEPSEIKTLADETCNWLIMEKRQKSNFLMPILSR